MMLTKMIKLSSLSVMLLGVTNVFAQVPATQEAPPAQMSQNPAQMQTAQNPKQAQDFRDSAAEADRWLKMIDAGNYGESWDHGSNIFRFTIKRDEWIKAQDRIRKPYGSLVSRQLIQQSPAENPKGLPAGDYMVLVYKSAFSNHPSANELVTMVRSTDGKWKVLTYQSSY